MNDEKKKILQSVANTVRGLTMDAVEKAKSGHPGLPMGCAELGAYLWGEFMCYDSSDPSWLNGDQFILSAGHGSMLVYSMLHLAKYNISLEDIKNFRQMGSTTPGHPECLETNGIRVTTGPLGQGVANACGMALGYKILEDRFNRDGFPIVTNKIICLAGDGCMMEGVSAEASSLAGHLSLNNLILIYDMNYVTLDGTWGECCSDNQAERYISMGWDVAEICDGNDLDQIDEVFIKLRGELKKPTIVIVHTQIGKGAPTKAGTNKAHGAPLGEGEIRKAKENLGLPQEEFYVPTIVSEYFSRVRERCSDEVKKWRSLFDKWKIDHVNLYDFYEEMRGQKVSDDVVNLILNMHVDGKSSGRAVSGDILKILGDNISYLIGGSADLSSSDCTVMSGHSFIKRGDFSGKNIKYGVREFAMTAMVNGMSVIGLRPYCGTFFVFSDYGRNAVRLAALSKYKSIFIYTHDSIAIGEDGPTHQPIEHLASFRAMPGIKLWRPADSNEIKGAWIWTILYGGGPVILVFTRQSLPMLVSTPKRDFENNVFRGGYVLIEEDKSRRVDFTLIGTGSELQLAVEVSEKLKSERFGHKNIRVISLPCWHLFEEQDNMYKNSVIGKDHGKMVSIEAGSTFGWERYIGKDGLAIGIDEFGRSAPSKDLMEYFGFTADLIVDKIISYFCC